MRTLAITLALFAGVAQGQNQVSIASGSEGFRATARYGPPPFAMRPITGAPYSADEVSESVQTLADGTRITRTSRATKIYRDSAGRTRTERPLIHETLGVRPNIPESVTIVEIIDPVARVRYVLNTQNKIAHRQELPAPGTRPAAIGDGAGGGSIGPLTATLATGGGSASAIAIASQLPPPALPSAARQTADATRPQTATEKLGSQLIEGVQVEGTRQTRTWPVGAFGNDRPITNWTETWVSPELGVLVLMKSSDPRSGEHTRKLINLSRSDPDPSLFQPPPDYTVVEEKGDFTVTWGPRQP